MGRGKRARAIRWKGERWRRREAGGGEPVRSGVYADRGGANSAKRTTNYYRVYTTTRSPGSLLGTSNLALLKNEDGAALKADKSLIGRSSDRSYLDVITGESRFSSAAPSLATSRRAFALNAPAPGGNKIKTRGGRGAKTTKKIVLRMECTECKYRKQIPLKRCKHFELGAWIFNCGLYYFLFVLRLCLATIRLIHFTYFYLFQFTRIILINVT
ncbi:hypothetical protein DBV15_02958 [Temnothorax longispinosus]|uniref:60S ribosomal protein L44 n=1 Tax=Temnothorax longispinosus TaxID=300112 RepID=A0A4S2JP52_9HYME|nr:hypothetical protein DBV15_02958 [Temnothorax longispinosus]